jgi:hypothetical protein
LLFCTLGNRNTLMNRKIATCAAYTLMLVLCSYATVYCFGNNKQEISSKGKIAYNKKKHSVTLSWPSFGASGNYVITRGGSRLASEFVMVGSTSKLTFTDPKPNADKYENYYKITRNESSIILSLEQQFFGDNMYFYDRKYEKQGTARNDINSKFKTTGLDQMESGRPSARAIISKQISMGKVMIPGVLVLHPRQQPIR